MSWSRPGISLIWDDCTHPSHPAWEAIEERCHLDQTDHENHTLCFEKIADQYEKKVYIYIIPIIYDPTLSSITDKKSSESNSNITSHLLSVVRQTAAHGHLRPKFRYDLDLNLDTTWPLKSHSWLCPKIWYRQIFWFPIHFFLGPIFQHKHTQKYGILGYIFQ